jgi:hypothetical protein
MLQVDDLWLDAYRVISQVSEQIISGILLADERQGRQPRGLEGMRWNQLSPLSHNGQFSSV